MLWLILATVVAITYAGQGLASKRLLAAHSEARVRWLLFAVAAPVLLAYLTVRGLPPVDPLFWPVLGVAVLGGLLSFYLFMRSLQLTDLSIAYPLISLTPLFMVPVEYVLIGDLPGPAGALGVPTIVAGVYVLNLRSEDTSLLDPFRAVLRDRGALTALALAVVWSVTGVVDKVAIRLSSSALYAAAIVTALAVLFAPAAWRANRGADASGPATDARGPGAAGDDEARVRGASRERVSPAVALFAAQGLLFAAMLITQYEAIQLTLVSYVISIKRAGILLSVLFGYFVLGEEELGYRLAGAAVIVLGVVLLAMG